MIASVNIKENIKEKEEIKRRIKMKSLISLVVILMVIGCSETITAPENTEATVRILNWTQEYNEELDLYGDIEILYAIENTGNVDIHNYELHFTIKSESGEGSAIRRYYHEIEHNEIRSFTYVYPVGLYSDLSFSPASEVKCTISELNLL
jgi:hypothetical protein